MGLKVATFWCLGQWDGDQMRGDERAVSGEELDALVRAHGAATLLGRALRELQERRVAPGPNEATEISEVEKRDLPGTDET